MTDQPVTTLDKLAIVKMLSRPTAMGIVIASNPHLTKARVEAIAADAGYPKINDLRASLTRLQRQAEDEQMGTIHTGPTDAQQAGTRNQDLVVSSTRSMGHGPAAASKQVSKPLASRPEQVTQGPRPYEPTAQLLLEARDSTSKRTIALAHKIEDLLVDLRDRLMLEAQSRREASLAEARKAREASQREQQRQAALAEVAAAEEALRAAREKARKFKNTRGGNGRAQVIQSPSSESRQPGGTSQGDALRARHTYQRELLERHGVKGGAVRQWAHNTGLPCPAQGGLLPRTVLDAYESAHPGQAAS